MWFVLLLFLGLPGLLGPHATASAQEVAAPVDEPAARRAFEIGRDAYDHGDFRAAVANFQRAYELSQRPALLFNIARAADADGQLQRAATAYADYLEALPAADNRDFVQGRIDKIRAAEAQASSRVEAASSAALPSVAQADRTRPGAPLAPIATTRSTADHGETRRPFWKRGWFWTAAGAVVVGGVVGGVLAATRRPEPARAAGDAYVSVMERP